VQPGGHPRAWSTAGELLGNSLGAVSALPERMLPAPGDVSAARPIALSRSSQSFRSRPLYQQKATIRAGGSVSICRVHGNSNRCHILCSCGEGPTPKLAYGQEMVVGRFRCQSLHTGMRCTLIRSGTGFLINKSRATKIA
jgi:hypothetical protein